MSTTLTRGPSAQAVAGPIVAIPFARLLRVEWRKATDTRAARWLLALSALGTVALMLDPLLNTGGVDQKFSNYVAFAALGITTLTPIVAILTLTTEWTQRTVLTTFTQEPRRSRVIGAKVGAASLIGLAAVAFGVVLVAGLLGIAAATGRHLDHDLGGLQILGFVLFVMLNMLMGVAFGALLHNTAASIVLFFVLPILFGFLGSSVKPVGRWVDPSTTFNWVLDGHWHGHAAQIAVSVVLWLVIPLAAGLVRTVRREIK